MGQLGQTTLEGYLYAQMVEHGALGTGATIVYSATLSDAGWCGTDGAAWSITLTDVVHLAHQ